MYMSPLQMAPSSPRFQLVVAFVSFPLPIRYTSRLSSEARVTTALPAQARWCSLSIVVQPSIDDSSRPRLVMRANYYPPPARPHRLQEHLALPPR